MLAYEDWKASFWSLHDTTRPRVSTWRSRTTYDPTSCWVWSLKSEVNLSAALFQVHSMTASVSLFCPRDFHVRCWHLTSEHYVLSLGQLQLDISPNWTRPANARPLCPVDGQLAVSRSVANWWSVVKVAGVADGGQLRINCLAARLPSPAGAGLPQKSSWLLCCRRLSLLLLLLLLPSLMLLLPPAAAPCLLPSLMLLLPPAAAPCCCCCCHCCHLCCPCCCCCCCCCYCPCRFCCCPIFFILLVHLQTSTSAPAALAVDLA